MAGAFRAQRVDRVFGMQGLVTDLRLCAAKNLGRRLGRQLERTAHAADLPLGHMRWAILRGGTELAVIGVSGTAVIIEAFLVPARRHVPTTRGSDSQTPQ